TGSQTHDGQISQRNHGPKPIPELAAREQEGGREAGRRLFFRVALGFAVWTRARWRVVRFFVGSRGFRGFGRRCLGRFWRFCLVGPLLAAAGESAPPSDRGHVCAILADRAAALLTTSDRLGARELVRASARVRRLAAEAGDLALLLRLQPREAAPLIGR